jgi:hypothetical protein
VKYSQKPIPEGLEIDEDLYSYFNQLLGNRENRAPIQKISKPVNLGIPKQQIGNKLGVPSPGISNKGGSGRSISRG